MARRAPPVRGQDRFAMFREHHPTAIEPAEAKLADAQLVIARSYQASSWTRLGQGVRLANAIWEAHLSRDPGSLSRAYSHREIYPTGMGCREPLDATVGTPLGDTTLLHVCVDYGELDIARWLLDRGMDVNARRRRRRDDWGQTPNFTHCEDG